MSRRERLSSRLTLFYKVILPAWWLGIMGLGTAAMFLAPGMVRTAELELTRWILLSATLFGAVMFHRLTFPLKRVHAGPASLFVSNFRREIEVPFRDVRSVSGSRFINPPLVRIELQRPSELGERIVFTPHFRWYFGFGEHPLVRELQQRIGAARG